MPHAYTTLARLDARLGNYARARKAFAQGAEAAEGNAPLLHVSDDVHLLVCVCVCRVCV
jgi:hypothetical protein